MKAINKGEYYGDFKQSIKSNNVIFTETTCKNTPVEWHYHKNSYLSYALEGHCIEQNKKRSYVVKPGTLLYHNWQDAHCNLNHSRYSRNFYIEIEQKWFKNNDINSEILEGSREINHPFIKALYHQIYLETKLKDNLFQSATESLLLNLFSQLEKVNTLETSTMPLWVNKVKEIIHDECIEKITLQYLSNETNIHKIHLSRDFSKYFNTNLGNYIRKVKIEYSVTLLATTMSLTEIAYQCGFSDQSHFIRSFKSTYNMTPNKFRKIIISR